MKELKIVLLGLAIGFGCSDSSTTKFPNAYYLYTVKGGLQTPQIHKPVKVVVPGVKGNYSVSIRQLL